MYMTPLQWATVPDNPRQRDTEAHAKKADHLRQYSPLHAMVNMAVLPDGRTFKLDAHTRSYLWSRGEVVPPQRLCVDVWNCIDLDAATELYKHFDNRAASETISDVVFGSARLAGIQFSTPMLRQGRFGWAVKRIYEKTHGSWESSATDKTAFLSDAVNAFSVELRLLDQVGPVPRLFPAGILMACLAMFRRYGTEPVEFLIAYRDGKGKKNGAKMDPVQALTEIVTGQRQTNARGKDKQVRLFIKAITAYEAYRRRDVYKAGKGGGIREMKEENLDRYLRGETLDEA